MKICSECALICFYRGAIETTHSIAQSHYAFAHSKDCASAAYHFKTIANSLQISTFKLINMVDIMLGNMNASQ